MVYTSIDIETTGLNEKEHQILEFAAIIEDTDNELLYDQLPKFRRIIIQLNDRYIFGSYACSLNKNLITKISAIKQYIDSENEDALNRMFPANNYLQNLSDGWCYPHLLGGEFAKFLEQHKMLNKFVIAGKNVGFDKKFLSELPYFFKTSNGILEAHHRHIDPTMYYMNWNTDKVPPATEDCKKRAGLSHHVSHEALSDAWDVIELIRIGRKKLISNSSL